MTRREPAAYRFAHEAMTTIFEVLIAGKSESYSSQAARALFDEVDRIEQLFNRFDPSSELSRIGRLQPGESMPIGVETYECLTLAARVRTETNGAFDINFRAPRSNRRRPPDRAWDLIPCQTLTGFEASRPRACGRKSPPPLDLDLGAIGKGYALDSALEVLKNWGIKNALIHAGTSTALGIGPGPGSTGNARGWPVGVATAWECRGAPRTIRLLDRALSGSGTEVKGEHIRDPRTGTAAGGHLAAWACHPSAAVSDALSTAFMVMGTEDVAAYCRGHRDVWGLVIIGEKKCRILNAKTVA